METRRDIFHAIADPTRRAILILIATHAMTPNAIAENFDISGQAISRHIQVLTECEIVKQENSGREIYYHLNIDKMKEIANWLAPFVKIWEERHDRLDTVLNKLKTKKYGK